MENQAYEEEQTRTKELAEQPLGKIPQGKTYADDQRIVEFSCDGHVYEDIEAWNAQRSLSSSKLLESSPTFYDGSESVAVEESERTDKRGSITNLCQRVPEGQNCTSTEFFPVPYQQQFLPIPRTDGFQRNLTLPFRRSMDPSNANSIVSSSVRVTSAERIDHEKSSSVFHEESQRDSTQIGPAAKHERSGKRRRKKDCKHCRNKANGLPKKIDDDPSQQSNANHRANGLFIVDNHLESGKNAELIGLNLFDGTSMIVPSSGENPLTVRASFQGSNNTKSSARTEVFTIESFNDRCKDVGTKPSATNDRVDDRTIVSQEKNRNGMRVNSIYSQDHWYTKDPPIFYTNVKQDNTFQRAFSLPVRTQTVSSQNRVNLRRSVRGEPPPHPARLHKHRHGWTLHLARPLDTPSCSRSLLLLLLAILALLGVGAAALYVVFEPEKLLVIRQYLKSSRGNSSDLSTFPSINEQQLNESWSITPTSTTSREALLGGEIFNVTKEENTTMNGEEETETVPPGETTTVNSTRYCDDCREGEVCVGLVDEEVPICRVGLDPEDPTGCAGLCLINKQRCHRLDVDAFRCVEVEHYCLDNEWTCSNTLCIPLEKRCDGHMNCYDHSDEYNCVCDPETHFQCGNETSCLPLDRKCDGKIDCWDAADEINCTLGRNLGWSCPLENEFTCSSGQCILKVRFCDGLADCTDESDEPQGCQGRCNKHEFTCRNGRCITKGMKCNGVDDCGDGTDEEHCKNRFA